MEMSKRAREIEVGEDVCATLQSGRERSDQSECYKELGKSGSTEKVSWETRHWNNDQEVQAIEQSHVSLE